MCPCCCANDVIKAKWRNIRHYLVHEIICNRCIYVNQNIHIHTLLKRGISQSSNFPLDDYQGPLTRSQLICGYFEKIMTLVHTCDPPNRTHRKLSSRFLKDMLNVKFTSNYLKMNYQGNETL